MAEVASANPVDWRLSVAPRILKSLLAAAGIPSARGLNRTARRHGGTMTPRAVLPRDSAWGPAPGGPWRSGGRGCGAREKRTACSRPGLRVGASALREGVLHPACTSEIGVVMGAISRIAVSVCSAVARYSGKMAEGFLPGFPQLIPVSGS